MEQIGIIFCGKCNGTKVDSGFQSESTLYCVDCGNKEEFKVGKVMIEEEKIIIAKKDAFIK